MERILGTTMYGSKEAFYLKKKGRKDRAQKHNMLVFCFKKFAPKTSVWGSKERKAARAGLNIRVHTRRWDGSHGAISSYVGPHCKPLDASRTPQQKITRRNQEILVLKHTNWPNLAPLSSTPKTKAADPKLDPNRRIIMQGNSHLSHTPYLF